jgi:threonine aldolase
MDALVAANVGHAVGYGDDPWTQRAQALFKKEFGSQTETFFVFNGTGSNVLALSLVAGAGQSVLCSDSAHIAVDEAGGPEANLGCKILSLRSHEGKVQVEALKEALSVLGSVHQAQPSCLSITQPTELGTLYSVEEMRRLVAVAHGAGLSVHMDGARLANAAVALDLPFRSLATEAGIDILSFGGMKNGVAFGEALIVLNPALAARAPFLRKTHLQLDSKMRYIAAQYEAYLDPGVWKRNAQASMAAARRLEGRLSGLKGFELALPVQSNALFVRIPAKAAGELRKEFFFYDWEGGLQRWMTSFDTSDEDVDNFARAVAAALARSS